MNAGSHTKASNASAKPAATTIFRDGSSPSHRASEALIGAIFGAVGAFLVIGTHRMAFSVGKIDIPWGIAFGAFFQVVASIVLIVWFGRKFPLIVQAIVCAIFCMMFAGHSLGGGILMPAEIAGEFQWQGWAAQLIGVLIPLIAAAVLWAIAIARLASRPRKQETPYPAAH